STRLGHGQHSLTAHSARRLEPFKSARSPPMDGSFDVDHPQRSVLRGLKSEDVLRGEPFRLAPSHKRSVAISLELRPCRFPIRPPSILEPFANARRHALDDLEAPVLCSVEAHFGSFPQEPISIFGHDLGTQVPNALDEPGVVFALENT